MARNAVWLMVAGACGEADTTATTTAATTSSPPETAATTTTLETTTSTSSPAPSQPRPGGIVIIGDDESPPTLNPYAEGGDSFIVALLAQALHTGVWDVDAFLQRRVTPPCRRPHRHGARRGWTWAVPAELA